MSTIKSMTDEELALAYIDGNNKAFDELLSRNQDKIFTYIMCVVKNEDVANDLFQETFLKVVTKLQNGQYSSTGKLFFWITRIAHNVIIDYYRSLKNNKVVDVAKDNDLSFIKSSNLVGDNHETEISKRQTFEDVVFLMNMLPEQQRDVVYMRYFEDLSFKEISQKTHVSINTSLGRMRYAILNMRKLSREYDINLCFE